MSPRVAAVLAMLEDLEAGVVGTLWVHLQPVEPGAGTPRRAVATGRDHAEAAVGRRLLVANAAWRIVSIERPGGGRMSLRLEL